MAGSSKRLIPSANKSMRLDNQLFRVAEIALRNEERLRAWRYRYEAYLTRRQSKHQTQQKTKNAAQKEKENVSKTNT